MVVKHSVVLYLNLSPDEAEKVQLLLQTEIHLKCIPSKCTIYTSSLQ